MLINIGSKENPIMENHDKVVKKFESSITTKYLYMEHMNAALVHAMRTARISWRFLNQEIIEAFKEALCNVISRQFHNYYDGFDPEFSSEEAYLKWEKFSMESYLLTTETEVKKQHQLNAKRFHESKGWKYLEKPLEEVAIPADLMSPFRKKELPYHVLIDKDYGTALDYVVHVEILRTF